jgi:rRNA maturation protein Rpf1
MNKRSDKGTDKLCDKGTNNVQTSDTMKSVSFSEQVETYVIPNNHDLWLYKYVIWYNKLDFKVIQKTLYMEAVAIKTVKRGWSDHKCLKQAALGKTTELSIIQPLIAEIINSIFEKTDLEM